MLQMALLIMAAQVSGLAVPPICTDARATELGGAGTEICLGEEEAQKANSADKSSSERRRQFEAAAQHYRRGANLAANRELKARALNALAVLYTEHLQVPDQAELVLRELIALTPDDLNPIVRLARLQEDRGWIDSAETTLIDARRQRPEDLEPYKVLAQFYARRVSAMSLQRYVEKPARPAQRDDQGVYRVGGAIESPRRIGNPVYPPQAQAAGISGAVIAEIVVNESGTVVDARVVRSIPFLDEAALEAVRTWQFVPTLVNGQPVPVRLVVTVNFTAR